MLLRVRAVQPRERLHGLDARQMLAALAGYIDELSYEDRHLLLAAVDGDCTDNGSLSSAQRVKLHRLRRRLAEKLWEELEPSQTKRDGDG